MPLENNHPLDDITNLIKRPARDACLYMGEASPPDPSAPPDPHFDFAIAPIL